MALTAPLTQLSHRRELVRHFTPNWFTATMGTGILSLALAGFPLDVPGLGVAAEVTAGSGGLIIPHLGATDEARSMLYFSYALWATSVLPGMGIKARA